MSRTRQKDRAGFGTDQQTGQPILTCEWIDRLARNAWAVVAAGTCAAYGGIHALQGNPTGCMGLADYLGWDWKSKAGIPVVNVPGCPVLPDNSMEVLLYLLYQAAGLPLQFLSMKRYDQHGSSAKPCMRVAIAAGITNRETSPKSMGSRSALSN